MPQIEVTFDIDANGILHVSAKDLKTGKEQKIRIEAGSGLSEADIKNMVRDAELHADEDKKRREEVAARNDADSAVYAAEKALKEAGDKVDSAIKARVGEHVEKVKKALGGTDVASIVAAVEALKAEMMKIGEALYGQAGGAPGAGPEPGPSPNAAPGGGHDDVVDAEFEKVDDAKR